MQSGPSTEFRAPMSDRAVTMSHPQPMVWHSAASSRPTSSHAAVRLPSLRQSANRARLASTPAGARVRSERTPEQVLSPRSPSVPVEEHDDARSENMSAQSLAFGPPARIQFSGRHDHDSGRFSGMPARVFALGPPSVDYAFSEPDEMRVFSEDPLPVSEPPVGLPSRLDASDMPSQAAPALPSQLQMSVFALTSRPATP